MKRPWGRRGGNASHVQRSASEPKREEKEVADDLLGLFPGEAAPRTASPQRESCSEAVAQALPSGSDARSGPELEGLGKYWSRDGQGRPFRLPFKPTEKDLQRARDLDQRIADFVRDNGLEDRVGRIMKNMLPDDVEQVLDEGEVPNNSANPNAVVVARVRRVERTNQRPNAMKRYDKRQPSPPQHARKRSRSSRRQSPAGDRGGGDRTWLRGPRCSGRRRRRGRGHRAPSGSCSGSW